MKEGSSIVSLVADAVIRAAAAHGADSRPLYDVIGLESQSMRAADAHVAIARYFELWDRIMATVGDPDFPAAAAAASRIEDQELFGFLAMSCESLGEAFARTARYRVLYNRGARWELQPEADATRLFWYPWPGDRKQVGVRAAIEFALCDMCGAARQLSGQHIRPLQVRIAHPAAGDRGGLRRFFGVEPTFEAPLDELVFAPDVLETPIRSFNSRLREYFDQQCQQLAQQFQAESPVSLRVRKELMAAMDGGEPSMEAVAGRLGMSGRSLHRRLAEEGCRFNDLLDETRQEFAKRYLARGTVSASEVAYLVGFQSPTAFFRAFKRWTGQTPQAYRPQAR